MRLVDVLTLTGLVAGIAAVLMLIAFSGRMAPARRRLIERMIAFFILPVLAFLAAFSGRQAAQETSWFRGVLSLAMVLGLAALAMRLFRKPESEAR